MQWNPWHGCHKCSPGCKNCYVYYLDTLRDKEPGIVVKNKTNFNAPIKKDRYGEYKIPPGSVLGACFTSDFFIEEADEWRGDAWDMIRKRNDVIFLIPTKRIARFSDCVPNDWGDGWENVAIAVSCENQEMADKRLPILLNAKIKHRLIFVAPILEYVELDKYLKSGKIEQVSVGGESYTGARVCNFDWVRKIREVCLKNGVVFDFHQTGSNFIKDGRLYHIKHCDEHSQAKKGMVFLENSDKGEKS